MPEPLLKCTSVAGAPKGEVFVGVDGCPIGWVAVAIDHDDRYECSVWSTLGALWAGLGEHASCILVDMPMGLPDRYRPIRTCDIKARKLLGPRSSSVFSVPCRKALSAGDYTTACKVNKQVVGRKMSKQTYNIMRKIREFDELVRSDVPAREGLREAHPELAFAYLAGGPMEENKKRHAGYLDRLDVLRKWFTPTLELLAGAARKFSSKKVARDDTADALALAVMARKGRLVPLPHSLEHDELNIPMAIWHVPWSE